MTALLQVQDLRVYYFTDAGPVKAVDGVSFALGAGERLGLAGESGSGKSTAVLALIRLVMTPGRIVGGKAWLDGIDVLSLPEEEMRKTRGSRISLIPQGAMNSLNPVMRIKHQLMDTIRAHDGTASNHEMARRVPELLEWVLCLPV